MVSREDVMKRARCARRALSNRASCWLLLCWVLLVTVVWMRMTILAAAAAPASTSLFSSDAAASSIVGNSTSLCPGITIEGCSDDGCLGFDAISCPDHCLYNAATQQCVGRRSCLLHACSGHGSCQLHGVTDPSSFSVASSSSAARCVCDEHYYGANCSVACNDALCADAYGITNLECSAEGECICPGHFTSLDRQCSACADGWYGVLCDVPCPCNGHGRCDRVSGVCVCFTEAERGYWDGPYCSHCRASHMGETCTTLNAMLTALPHAVMTAVLDSPAATATTAGGDAVTLQWRGTRQLVVSRGTAVICGDVTRTADSGGAWKRVELLPSAEAPFAAPRVVRSSTVLQNGTVALLAVGERVNADTSTNAGSMLSTGATSIGVSVVHCTAAANASHCDFVVVEDVELPLRVPTATITAAAVVVDAQLSEKWGWAVLWADGSVALQHRLADSLRLPADFTGKSLHVEDDSGVVFVVGGVTGAASGGEWAVYATHSSDGAAGFVSVPFDGITAEMTGVAWRMNTSDGRLYMVGLSSSSSSSFPSSSAATVNAVWVLAGTLSMTADVTSIAVTVQALSRATLEAGEAVPRTVSLFSSDDDAGGVASLLCVVQTDTNARTFVWVMNSGVAAAAPPQWELRNSQDITADVADTSGDLHMRYVWPNGLLLFFQSRDAATVVIHTYTGYAVATVVPHRTEALEATLVMVQGIFLRNGMTCYFDAVRGLVSGILLNSTALMCVPPPKSMLSVCAFDVVAVAMPENVTIATAMTDNEVLLQRCLTPSVFRAQGSDTAGPYTSLFSRVPIAVYGQGFVNHSELQCTFYDLVVRTTSPGRYVSSQQVMCDYPVAITTPTKALASVMTVSFASFGYAAVVPFVFIGAAKRLAVVAPSTAIIVASAAFVALPTLQVSVVDTEGNELHELDRDNRTGTVLERIVTLSAPWFNSTRKEVAGPINPASSLVVLAYSNTTTRGVTTFSVFLQYPLVGVGLLRFSSPGLAPAEITYAVVEGEPNAMEVAVQPSPQLSGRYADTSRQPVVVFRDIAGNVVSSEGALRATRMQNVSAVYFNGVSWVSRPSGPNNANGYFDFSAVNPRGFFGHSYHVTFTAPGFPNATSIAMTPSRCYVDEYGRYDTTSCLPCPSHATCNGSYVFNVTDGYWKGGELAYDVYPCPRPRVCRAGECITGYTGVLCGVCDDGYGMTGSQCVRCFSTAANVVLVVLLTVFVVLVPFLLTLLTFQAFGSHVSLVHGTRSVLDLLQLTGLILLPMPELPDYVERFIVFTELLSTGNALELSPFSCLFTGLNAMTKFVVELVAVWVFLVVLLILLLYGDVLFARHTRALRKRRRFLQLLAPFPSAEAYHHRLEELGLDEERALGGATTAATLDPRQRTLREAYALLDNNRYAIMAVSQLPNSVVRELALESLLAEQEELGLFLRQCEANMSDGGGGDVVAPITTTTAAAAASPSAMASSALSALSSSATTATTMTTTTTTTTAMLASAPASLAEATAATRGKSVRLRDVAARGTVDSTSRVHGSPTGSGGSGGVVDEASAASAASSLAVVATIADGGAMCANGGSPLTHFSDGTSIPQSDAATASAANNHGDDHDSSNPGGGGSSGLPPRGDAFSTSPLSAFAAASSSSPSASPVRVRRSHHHHCTPQHDPTKGSGGDDSSDAGDDDNGDHRVSTAYSLNASRAGRGGDGVMAAAAARAAVHDFEGITPTPFSLFGADEPFKPTPTTLHFLHPQLLPATELVAPQQQRQSPEVGANVVWPRFAAQMIVLCFTVYDYFFITVMTHSFGLVQCEETTIAVVGTTADGAESTSQVVSHMSLALDRRVNCRTDTYRAYRVAGIVLGSLYGAAVPLLLVWLSWYGSSSRRAAPASAPAKRRPGGVAYLRDCCLAVLGLGEPFLWWEALTLLFKWALVLVHSLIPSKNVAGLVVFWTVLCYFAFLVYLRPFYSFFPQSLQVIVFLTLTLMASLQLVPLLYSATMENGVNGMPNRLFPAQQASGVLVVALPCLALVLLLFVVWASTFSRQRWRRLGGALFALGGGVEVPNILHFLHRRGRPTQRKMGPSSPSPGSGDRGDGFALRFSFAGYNMHVAQQARRDVSADDDDAEDGGGGEMTLMGQVTHAVRGKAACKGSRRSGGLSLWANWSVVGGLIGMANHVHLLAQFIHENEGAVLGEAALATTTTTTTVAPATTAAEGVDATPVDASQESVVQPLTVMNQEAGEELLTMCEHLRQLEHFVLQMEKALERRTES